MDAGGWLPPASKFNVSAGTKGKPPLRGTLQMSLEEVLLHDLAMLAQAHVERTFLTPHAHQLQMLAFQPPRQPHIFWGVAGGC